MAREHLTVALLREVFLGEGAALRLRRRLEEARAAGAELAMLPELPLDPWVPATPNARDEDAEPVEGPRHRLLSEAAAAAGIGLLGGAVVRDPAGRRFNTALVFAADGALLAAYRKVHLPEEEGFWETSHYEPGADPPPVVSELGLPIGVEICSDVNRPELAHALAAAGAMAILVPRATEAATFDRWRLVMQATALTTASYVLSVPRPAAEGGVSLGGPSVVLSPDGEILVESSEPLVTARLARRLSEEARGRYPGYLAVRSDVYARAWAGVTPSLLPRPGRRA